MQESLTFHGITKISSLFQNPLEVLVAHPSSFAFFHLFWKGGSYLWIHRIWFVSSLIFELNFGLKHVLNHPELATDNTALSYLSINHFLQCRHLYNSFNFAWWLVKSLQLKFCSFFSLTFHPLMFLIFIKDASICRSFSILLMMVISIPSLWLKILNKVLEKVMKKYLFGKCLYFFFKNM